MYSLQSIKPLFLHRETGALLFLFILFKICYAGSKDGLELVAADVFEDVVGAEPFCMGHLAEDAAVGAGNAFDSEDRLVRVVFAVVGRLAGQVDVLRGDLSFGG